MAPPAVLHLTGPGLSGEPAKCLGYFELEMGRTVNGSPVWKQRDGSRRLARFESRSWGVQLEHEVGENLGWLVLRAKDLIYPSEPTEIAWVAHIDGAYTAQPQVACAQQVRLRLS